jgi:hypothetical protein
VRIAALVVSLAAIIALVVILASGGDSGSSGDHAGGKGSSGHPNAGSKASPSAAPPATRRTGALSSWPPRDAYTVVIAVASGDRAGVEARARRAIRRGYRAGVLQSGDYPNLPPGLQVAFAGVYKSKAKAQAAAQRLREQGLVASPYVRLIRGSGS